MRLRTFAVLFVAPVVMLGCNSPSGDSDGVVAGDGSVLPGSSPANEQVDFETLVRGDLVRGDLVRVDMDAGTLTMIVDDVETTMSVNQETEVTGVTNRIQGLTGREGTVVSVAYREGSNGKEALRVHVE
jgi:hypothetical protein